MGSTYPKNNIVPFFKFLAYLFFALAIIINPYTATVFLSSDNSLGRETTIEVIIVESILAFVSLCIIFLCRKYPKITEKTKNLILNIILIIISLLIVIAMLEIAMRIVSPQITYHKAESSSPSVFAESDYLPWQLLPLSSDRFSDPAGEFNTLINTNSQGMRDNEFDDKKPTLLILGDSFTYGFGVENNETYSNILEYYLSKNLTRSQRAYQVMNAGYSSGYSPDTYYLYLKNEGLLLSPEKVIVGFFVGNDINDLSKNIWLPIGANLPERVISPEYYVKDGQLRFGQRKKISNSAVFSYISIKILHNSHLYLFLRDKINNIISEDNVLYTPYWDEDLLNNLEKVERVLLEMERLTSREGIEFIVLLLPGREQVIDEYWESYSKEVLPVESSRTLPQEVLKDFFKKNNITYLDLYPSIHTKQKDTNLYFPIDGHPNREGHKFIAEQLFIYLQNNTALS